VAVASAGPYVCLFVYLYYLLLWANISANLLAFSLHLRLDVLSYFLYCKMYVAVSKINDDDDDNDLHLALDSCNITQR